VSDKEYRTALGFVFHGPYEKDVTTGQGVKKVIEYMLSAVGLNGDVVIKLSFWDSVPDFVKIGSAVLVSGAFDTYAGKDKEGNEKTTRTINVNKIVELGENAIGRPGKQQVAPAKKRKPAEADLDDDLGF
jgi:hypothetical protein